MRGFVIGATAGRTTLNGEGLQHEDGHSLLLASTNPAVVAYDPAYAFELGHIVKDGLRRMYGENSENIFYYLTQKKLFRMLKNLLKSELSGCSCINLRIDVNTHRALSCNKHPSHRSSFAKKEAVICIILWESGSDYRALSFYLQHCNSCYNCLTHHRS